MKALKIIGITILLLLIVLLILNFLAPKDYLVERSLIIEAPKEIVFKHVKYWSAWKEWSPWAEQDPQMEVTIEGIDGEVGSAYKWTGDPEITGKGEMINIDIKENQEITYHLHFMKPFESESDGYLRLLSDGKQVKALWGFSGVNKFPMNIMMLFMDMDEMVGSDFDRGLELLKKICEQEAQDILKYKIHKSVLPAAKYASVKGDVSFPEMKDFFAQSYVKIMKTIKRKNGKMIGSPSGLYFSWDEKNRKGIMAAAIPVNKNIRMNDVITINIDPGIAYYVDYYGPYDQSANAHYALDLYLQRNKLTQKSLVIEEYVTDPSKEPDSSKWLTKIYYYVE